MVDEPVGEVADIRVETTAANKVIKAKIIYISSGKLLISDTSNKVKIALKVLVQERVLNQTDHDVNEGEIDLTTIRASKLHEGTGFTRWVKIVFRINLWIRLNIRTGFCHIISMNIFTFSF